MSNTALINDLTRIIGKNHVLTGPSEKRLYSKGYRFGEGDALAVIRPATLLEYWQSLQAIVRHDAIIILQAANTGLTGGSTPNGTYDRPVIIVSTIRLTGIHLLQDGAQAICLPGARLNELENALDPFDREPHSVIGSSCIGASVIGGVCNNSGGALVRRGPVYTELSLYAELSTEGDLKLVNHLGCHFSGSDEELLQALDAGDLRRLNFDNAVEAKASADDYEPIVRDTEASTPARYNADPSRLHEASGCAGKLAVFAVRLDTFPKPKEPELFYIAVKDAAALTDFRRQCLERLDRLPIIAEYMDYDAYRVANRYGKDTFLAIKMLGERRIPALFTAKARFDTFMSKLSPTLKTVSDKVLQFFNWVTPNHMPSWMNRFHNSYPHHLLFKMEADKRAEICALLDELLSTHEGAYRIANEDEAQAATLNRFAAAGAAIRLAALKGEAVGGIAAIDVALPRNCNAWSIKWPAELEAQIEEQLVYGHFFCHVFHLDFVVKRGVDPHTFEAKALEILEAMGAEYPAEHNVGHMYEAKTPLADFYKSLDPSNSFNPGIGKTSRCKHWH